MKRKTYLIISLKLTVIIGLKLYRNLSDKLVTISGIVKRRICRYSPALQLGTHVVLPCTVSISNGLSCTLEVYRKVLHALDCILEGPLWEVVH